MLVERSTEFAAMTTSSITEGDRGTVYRQFSRRVGATLNAVHMAQGSWDQETSENYSINWLELKTVHLGLVHFLDLLKNKSVMIRSDNLATVYNLTKQGGTHSPDLCYLAWEILRFCRDHHITIRVQHLTGERNVITDQLSRAYKAISTEWTLNKSVFRAVANELVPEQPASGLCETMPGPSGSSPGCSQLRLEHSTAGLRVSTRVHSTQSAIEDTGFHSNSPDSTGMADTILVSRPAESPHPSTSGDSSARRSPHTTGGPPSVDPQQSGDVQFV